MRKRKQIWMLLAAVIALATTCYVFRSILRDPAHVVHELGGDGIKNYYSYIYHAMYGQGWWFDGMNYPHGEHIMFVDGQPALTVTLSWLRQWWHFTPETLNIILNLLMFFAFFLAIVYLYKVIAKLGVAPWWAMLFAPLIVAMSMQNFRVFGLYGLSYACVIPMMFYWFLHYYETGKKKYMLWLFILACIVMLLHPYQLALILIWSFFYVVGYWLLVSKPRKEKIRHTIPVALAPLAAFIILKTILAVTDPVTDRPGYPHGLLSYGTTGIDIFTNTQSPYWSWLQKKGLVTGPMGSDAESYAYIGVTATVVIALTLIVILLRLLRKRKNEAKDLFSAVPPVWWFIAGAALLFSMGVPFVWGMQWAFDYVATLRQFRALNWFALLFYYITTVISVVIIFRVATPPGATTRRLRQIFIIIPLGIWGYESWSIASKLHEKGLSTNYNYAFFNSHIEKDWPTFLKENNLSGSDFQAALFIPYQHVGSEKIWLSHSNWGLCISMKAAFQLQLPLVDANMSRSSWSMTFEQVKTGAGPYAYKSILHETEDNRPFLLMHFEGEELTPDERYLFNHADSIGVNSNLVAYALYPRQLAALEKKQWKRIMVSTRTDTPYYYEPFVQEDKQTIFGEGSQAAVIGRDTTIATIDVRNWPKDKWYEASAWFLVNNKDYRTPSLELKYFDSAGTQLNLSYLLCGEANDTWDMWFRPNRYFKLPDGTVQVALCLNVAPDVVWYRLDEIMIRAASDTIVMKDNEGRVMVNNHILPTNN